MCKTAVYIVTADHNRFLDELKLNEQTTLLTPEWSRTTRLWQHRVAAALIDDSFSNAEGDR